MGLPTFQNLLDLAELITTKSTKPLLSLDQLTTFFDLPRRENDQPNMVDLFNACWQAQSNPKVAALPDEERIHFLRSCAAAMDASRFLIQSFTLCKNPSEQTYG